MKYDLDKKQSRFAQRILADFSSELISLLKTKSLENIKVAELCERCNYPRATFYNYFDDIYDLFSYCLIVFKRKFKLDTYDDIEPNDRARIMFDRLYEVLAERQDELREVVKHNPQNGIMMLTVREFIKQTAAEMVLNCPENDKHTVPIDIMAQHYANTIELLIEHCFFTANTITKSEAEYCIEQLLDCIK